MHPVQGSTPTYPAGLSTSIDCILMQMPKIKTRLLMVAVRKVQTHMPIDHDQGDADVKHMEIDRVLGEVDHSTYILEPCATC